MKSMNLTKLEWLTNRIKKNTKKLAPLLRQWQTDAYRLYDKDIPEIPYQIDRLGDDYWITEKGVHSDKIELSLKEENYQIIKTTLKSLFNCADENLWWQTRQDDNYSLNSEQQKESIIHEGQIKLSLRLGVYRDMGLFLDHRPLRLKLAKLAVNPTLNILNLFCYTSSFSVHCAMNGHRTVNIDLSNTYLEWSKHNFAINGIDLSKHQFLHADVLKWFNGTKEPEHSFDLIILDPPSFSNSKRMGDNVLDIQRDHINLITQCMRFLKKQTGVLYFSTNLRSFKLDSEKIDISWKVENISAATIPADFRDQKIHQCYKITTGS